jgi:cytoskeletal protein CcmA (bactofilin family)
MKRILFFLFAVLTAQFADAQSVGIGTATPNARAALEINSTTKGLLIPSMTTSQRLAIASPPNGLMVYDTERNSFYHYTGTTWSAILNGDYWIRSSASRSRISNPNDSVGIGTNSPTEWLDVDGNIRSRNNINADNDIRATGDVSAGNVVTSGNLVAAGVSTLNGDVTTNSDLIINNTTATFQLKSSGDNKGFFQLSGNNVRFGTNSGNTTGNVIVRLNGSDRVSINPSGDIALEGKITTPNTGSVNMLPLSFGRVGSDGTITGGSGNFTVTKVGVGVYRILCTGISSSSVILTSTPSVIRYAAPFYISSGVVEIRTLRYCCEDEGDAPFNFVIYQ